MAHLSNLPRVVLCLLSSFVFFFVFFSGMMSTQEPLEVGV